MVLVQMLKLSFFLAWLLNFPQIKHLNFREIVQVELGMPTVEHVLFSALFSLENLRAH